MSQPASAGPKLDALRSTTASLPPVGDREMSRQIEELLATPTGRRRIWDFSTHLHCSIIGTCLSTSELRHLLSKLGLKEATTASEHDVHASGVLIASRRGNAAGKANLSPIGQADSAIAQCRIGVVLRSFEPLCDEHVALPPGAGRLTASWLYDCCFWRRCASCR
jgi:hypothetical protein